MYHGCVYKNKQIRKLLGNLIGRFVLAYINPNPAKRKNWMKIEGNKVTIFGNDFVAKGYLKKK